MLNKFETEYLGRYALQDKLDNLLDNHSSISKLSKDWKDWIELEIKNTQESIKFLEKRS